MKKIQFLLITVLFLNSGIYLSFGQTILNNEIPEKVTFYTDRNLYIVGEKVFFSGSVSRPDLKVKSNKKSQSDKFFKNKAFSKVVYVELINPLGLSVIKKKFGIDSSLFSGAITIPDDILSGVYALRVYTKVMQNCSPDIYRYVTLKIVNPTKSDIVENKSGIVDTLAGEVDEQFSIGERLLSVNIDKANYVPREDVQISINKKPGTDSIKFLSMTVVPHGSTNFVKPKVSYEGNISDQAQYPDEKGGLLLMGTLKDKKHDKGIGLAHVGLTIFDNSKDFISTTTDSVGNFCFVLPMLHGNKNVLISSESSDDAREIFIGDDFCTKKISLAQYRFNLSKREQELAFEMAQNRHLLSSFYKMHYDSLKKSVLLPFYGQAKFRFELDGYVQLPTIEDCINEIVSILYIVKDNGKRGFKVFSKSNEINFYKPLVLVDMIECSDIDKLLKLSPDKIGSIEIVDGAYVRGDNIYGGIVSFFSKKGDYAGMQLPSPSVMIKYSFLNPSKSFEATESLKANIPDVRNTLLWVPQVVIGDEKIYTQKFKCSDYIEDYDVILRGIKSNDEEFVIVKHFKVN